MGRFGFIMVSMNKKALVTISALMISVGLTSVLVFQNCGAPLDLQQPPEPMAKEKSSSEEIANLEATIQELNEQELGCEADQDCEPFAMGTKACGGPAGYIVVSNRNPNLLKLSELAERLRTLQAAQNLQSGVIGTCEFETPPEPRCVSSRCRQ